jgi:uncharacterized protein YcsI (UPF0317 family)
VTEEGFTVRGADRLISSMKKAAANLEDLRAVNKAVAQAMAPAASTEAPRRSGKLAKSVRGTGTKREARIRSALVYGNPIHWGWPAHRIVSDPFITDAIDTRNDEVANTYENALEDEIGRIKGA